jgi:hypothetical protein
MINNTDDIGRCLISEFYEFKSDPALIQEFEEKKKPLVMTGILQKADTLNRNGRVYPYDILKREVDKYMELVENNTAGGELDHPSSPVVSLATVSHRVTDMWWQGKDLYGKVLIAEETDAGKTLKGLLKAGFMLGISSRGVGSVKTVSGKDVVQDDFELIAFDFVSSPSTPGAYLFKESKEYALKGMIPLTQHEEKLIKNITQEQRELYKKLQDLSNNNFWKNK